MPFNEKLRSRLFILKQEFHSGLIPISIYEELCRTTIAEFGSFAYETGASSAVVNQIEHVGSPNTNNKREIHVNVIGLPANKVQKIEHLESPPVSTIPVDMSYNDDLDDRKAIRNQTNRRSYSKEEKLLVVALRDCGLSSELIAKQTGVSKSNVEKWVSEKVRVHVIEKAHTMLRSGGFSSENINFWDGDPVKRESLIKQVEQRAVTTMHTTPQPVVPHSNYKTSGISIPENEINTCLLMVQLLKESISPIDIHRTSQLIPYNLSVYLAGSNSKDIYDLRTLKSVNKPQVVTQNNPTIGNRSYNASTTPEAVKTTTQWDSNVAHARAHLQWIKESGADVSQYEQYLFNKPTHPDVPYKEFMEFHSMPVYPRVDSTPCNNNQLLKHVEHGEETLSHPSVMLLNNPTMGGITHNAALSHNSTKTPEQWYYAMEATRLTLERDHEKSPQYMSSTLLTNKQASVATVSPKYSFPPRVPVSSRDKSSASLSKSKLISELLEAAGVISTEEDGSYSMDMGDLAPLQRSSNTSTGIKIKPDPNPSGLRHRDHFSSSSRMSTESFLEGQMKEMYTSVRSDMPVSLHMVSDVTMSFDSSMLNNPFEDISMNTVSHALRPVITNTALLTSFHEAETAMISALSTVNITDWTAKEIQDAEDKRILSLLGETQSFPMISQSTRKGMMASKTKL